MKNRRDKLFKRKTKGQITTEYVDAVNKFNELFEHRKREIIQQVQDNIKTNPAEFWKFAKLNNESSAYPNKMHYGNETADSPNSLVDLFAKYFESIYEPKDQTLRFSDISSTTTRLD